MDGDLNLSLVPGLQSLQFVNYENLNLSLVPELQSLQFVNYENLDLTQVPEHLDKPIKNKRHLARYADEI